MIRSNSKPVKKTSSNNKQPSIASFFSKNSNSASLKNSTTSNAFKKSSRPSSPQKEISSNQKATQLNKKSMLLFSSQGSFDENDPDFEVKKLMNKPHLNHFKKSRLTGSFGTLCRTSSNSSVSSSTISHHLIQDEMSDSISSITSFTSIKGSSPRKISFTRNISNDTFTQSALSSKNPNASPFEEDFGEMTTSTQFSLSASQSSERSNGSTSSLKRLTFQGLDLQTKRIKPIKRHKSSLSSSQNKNNLNNIFSELKLTKEQQHVIDLIIRKKFSVFYSGSAGTGKSIILRTIIGRLNGLYGKDTIAVTASTGLAASTIGGVTLHRWAGIGLGGGSLDSLVNKIQKNHELNASWKNTRVLIVDEISMVDGKFLDRLEEIARRVRKINRPFGGIQLVLTGDFFQLPPVSKKEYNEPPLFCFESNMWKLCVQKTILLTKVFRQQDNELVDILNKIRFGEIEDHMVQRLRSLRNEKRYSDGIKPTELYATRREVESSNSRQLDLLLGEKHEYVADDTGPKELHNLIDSSVMVERKITLKENAQVMMLKNKVESELVNGSLGIVLFFIPQTLEKKMNEIYRIMDEEAINDMKLVSKVVGNPRARLSKEFQEELNMRPFARMERLENILFYATTRVSPKDIKFPYVKWTLPLGRFHHELMLPDNFVVDLPGSHSALQRSQIPIMLCWALSIHKSQGQTLQRLKVDLRNIFEAGQIYVALSRAISMDTLQVLNFDPSKIKVNEKVKEFYQKLETVS
ncbi:hypothetical protein TPHA_0D01660 [Tetrapisispora phaffii CBS 4417]|uniref:ATP-dependent DNA helicase RRM3 n=1 Tax=Tetrapisispora phaffii (strain ATCC 24235 / CBS 4417 / NBRC 1672 / NRRL Y-8282 / UCD 70-5) TaxID=1071381 RepID=G8BSI5_TETPH|nr:hypothetical protein TPHA_0D01660 [Tetrapisispora phaffii CBS 4417]CCE62806.1 hypothetical protein TPHA_0D01660 [Tetrapisispora phaffii CBS 4417]